MPTAEPTNYHYFLRLAYDGTAYRGWQRQPGGVITVQQTLEDTLSEVHGQPISLGACGRTDTGVHATQFYVYLRTEAPLADNYLFIVNKRLPQDIAVHQVLPVPDNAQARYDATERTYDYFLHGQPDAWLDRASGRFDLDSFEPARAARALPLFLAYHDFRAFCKAPDRHNTTIVHFREVTLFRNAAGDRYRLRFVANRFLRGMIRLLVDKLVRVGKGTLTTEELTAALASGERSGGFYLAPASGLYLTGVSYPYLAEQEAVLPAVGREEWIEVTPGL